jgi:hypothetical protein
MLGESTETGATFFTRAQRNKIDNLFYFQDTSLNYTIPITEEFSLLKFKEPGGEPD